MAEEKIGISEKVFIGYESPDRVEVVGGSWDSVPTPQGIWREISRKWEIKRINADTFVARRRLQGVGPDEAELLRQFIRHNLTKT